MMPRQWEARMRTCVLLVYTAVAAWVAWSLSDSAWAVLHLTGAAAGVCATSMAVSYAGAIGAVTPGPVEDQGAAYMDREVWDD